MIEMSECEKDKYNRNDIFLLAFIIRPLHSLPPCGENSNYETLMLFHNVYSDSETFCPEKSDKSESAPWSCDRRSANQLSANWEFRRGQIQPSFHSTLQSKNNVRSNQWFSERLFPQLRTLLVRLGPLKCPTYFNFLFPSRAYLRRTLLIPS